MASQEGRKTHVIKAREHTSSFSRLTNTTSSGHAGARLAKPTPSNPRQLAISSKEGDKS